MSRPHVARTTTNWYKIWSSQLCTDPNLKSLLQNQLPSPTNSPYLCRQRNAARQAGDVEAGSLLESAAASNANQTVGNGSIVTAAEPTPKNDIV